ncbi:hypothetical protein [Pantoea vagans]|nr:hypothetical protein [Pantoea vagans]
MKKSKMRSYRRLLAALILFYLLVCALLVVALSLFDAPVRG